MLLIYTKKTTNRVKYIFHLLINDLLGIETRFTSSLEEFLGYTGPRFSYGELVPDDELYFAAHPLLFETGISLKTLNYIEFKGNPAFFSVFEKRSCFPFDIFAASFYLVSRYEEYLPHIRDEHGRFMASGSEAFKHGFLRKPLVNIWAIQLGDILSFRFPSLKQKRSEYKFELTIDIDAAYAFKHKGMTRAVGGILKALQKGNYSEIRERLRVLLHKQNDPFDTFEYLFQLQSKFKLKLIYFVLMADYGPRDKNIPVNNRQFHRLIKLLSDYADVGIHPSYASFVDVDKLKIEISRLSRLLHQDVSRSRQHFLRLEFPRTYRTLINHDITDDYTMGYSEEPGFRASICNPFYFYDLDMDMETHLKLHPFAIMDGTLNDYLRLTPAQSVEIVESLIKETKSVGGTFIPLWHNHSLNDHDEWKGWLALFEKMVENATRC
ncbi:MAG: hypothetical protein HXX13_11420 [Bacteroidetes bacterium]|nr:hypothetical protein [Bacteroidota bacterium]